MFKVIDSNYCRSIIVNSKEYKKVKVYLTSDNKIGDLYYVTATKNKKVISAIIDKDGNEIIPFSENILDEIFYTDKLADICVGFKLIDSDIIKYYHLQKVDDKYRIVISTDPSSKEELFIRQVNEYKDYWVFEKHSVDKDSVKYAIYKPKERRLITTFFDELSFDLEDNPYGHFAYFANYISFDYVDPNTNQEEVIDYSTVCGFIDCNGYFSSQLLDVKEMNLYNSYEVGSSSISFKYTNFISSLVNKYYIEYSNSEDFINQTITYLFNNYNQSRLPKSKEKAKILEFSDRKKDRKGE